MSIAQKASVVFNGLLRSLAARLSGLELRIGQDFAGQDFAGEASATMEKLDAALNNMGHGLCMFGPDNRLLLWNDRYVTMYRIAPGRLRRGHHGKAHRGPALRRL